jgi:hypothetical protein
MQRNHVLPWVSLAGIAACPLGMAVLSANGRCALVPWLRDDRSMVLVVLLPLLVCLSWGYWRELCSSSVPVRRLTVYSACRGLTCQYPSFRS